MTKPPMRDRDDFGVALVTGAGSGIGQGIALRLAELGARVVVTDIAETGIADTVKQIEAAGGTALGQKLDVSDPASVNAAFDETERWDKCVDVLVNNAGIVGINPFLDFPLEDWNRVMAINLTGSMLCAQLAAREMVRQRYGRTAYGTSKAALVGLTRQIALEVAAHGVTANAIAPGAITTPLTESTYTEETVARLLPMIPAGYMADPADIAAAVAYLGSPDARYVNGETLVVDGGYVCGGMMQTGSLDLGTKSSS